LNKCRVRGELPLSQRGQTHWNSAPANRFLEREAGDFNNAMDPRSGGLEVLTGLALIVGPSLVGALLSTQPDPDIQYDHHRTIHHFRTCGF
jgi:hypothetical protein